jgi:hypothetical protein
VNDNPGKNREEPENDPEDLNLDDELLREEDDVEIPAFLTENEDDADLNTGPAPSRPVPLSSIFRDPTPLFPEADDEDNEAEDEPPVADAPAPVPLSSIFRDPAPLFPETHEEPDDEDEDIEEFQALQELEPETLDRAGENDEDEEPVAIPEAYARQQPVEDEEAALAPEHQDEEARSEAERPLGAAAVSEAGVASEEALQQMFRRRPRSLPEFEPAGRGARTGVQQPQVFTVFKPESNSGSFLGVVAVLFCLVVGVALIFKSFSHDPSLAQFFPLVVGPILLFLGALFAYWTWGSLSLRYVIDRNALTIRWGAQRQIVPLINIDRLIPADPEGEDPDIRGVDWPGHHIGRARVAQLGEVLFYSGHRRASDILYVQTASETYGISVADPVAFAQAVQSNQMRGSLFEQRQAVHRDGIAAQSFWIDPQARFLTVILLAAFVMVLAYVLQTYPGLAQSVPLRFPALGGLLRVTDKSELLDIPRSAAAFLGLNLVLAIALHPWERMVSIVLLLAGIAIQLALLVAAIVAVA